MCTQNFLKEQGLVIKKNILFQDNKSTILLENNGRASVGKRSRHLDIRYFFITDHIQRGNLEVQYCPTEQMTADYFTKPLHGKKFIEFKKKIMNLKV